MSEKSNKYHMYTSDIAHCKRKDCPRYKKCYRGWLDSVIKERNSTGIATYFLVEDVEDCKHFCDLENY